MASQFISCEALPYGTKSMDVCLALQRAESNCDKKYPDDPEVRQACFGGATASGINYLAQPGRPSSKVLNTQCPDLSKTVPEVHIAAFQEGCHDQNNFLHPPLD